LGDHFHEVVERIVCQHYILCRLLDVVNFDIKVVHVSNTESCRDVELFQSFTEVSEFRMRHLGVLLRAD